MNLSPAETRVLNLVASHGKAERDLSKSSWAWTINGETRHCMSGPLDRLIIKGALNLSADKSTATLSALGRGIITQLREAA